MVSRDQTTSAGSASYKSQKKSSGRGQIPAGPGATVAPPEMSTSWKGSVIESYQSRRGSAQVEAMGSSPSQLMAAKLPKQETSRSTVGSRQSVDLANLMMSGLSRSRNATLERSGSHGLGAGSGQVTKSTTLDFYDKSLQLEYERYFLDKTIHTWRRSVIMVFLVCTALYAYVMIKGPSDSAAFHRNRYDTLGTMITAKDCPNGWLCTPCKDNVLCNSYSWTWDLAFWIMTACLPCICAIGATFYLTPVRLAKLIHVMSAGFILSIGLGAISGRFSLVEPTSTLYYPGILNLIFMFVSFTLLRVRFVITGITSSTWVVGYVLINLPQFFNDNELILGQANTRAYFVTFLALIATAAVCTFASYEIENYFRSQFLSAQNMIRTNVKLTNQLRTIQKAFNTKAADFDSPFEKCVCILRGLMADPGLGAPHLMALGQAMTLLGNSNFLTPDFETQMSGIMDNEQEAWLFSEIVSRRKKSGTTKAIRSRTTQQGYKLGNEPTLSATSEPIPEVPNGSAEVVIKESVTSLMMDEQRMSMEVATLLKQVGEYNFPIFDFRDATQGNALVVLGSHLFRESDLFNHFRIPADKFKSFMIAIQSGYHTHLPYHNSLHACDVLHCIAYLCATEGISKMLSELELLAMYLAAIIHDFDHPGFNNNFLVNTSDPKAILYNDKSVLENHHIAYSWQILGKPENDFLSHMPKSETKVLREIVVEMVLATDLSQHFPLVNLFKTKVLQGAYDPMENKEDRTLLHKILMKCADVSNPTKDFKIYERWYKLVLEEFFRQGDMEKKLNLPVSPFMDRDTVNVPSSQSGFIEFIVLPLFTAFDSFNSIPMLVDNLSRNREHWAKQKLSTTTNPTPSHSITSITAHLEEPSTPPPLPPIPAAYLPPVVLPSHDEDSQALNALAPSNAQTEPPQAANSQPASVPYTSQASDTTP